MARGVSDPTPAAMAATLETLVQLQQQLLSFTAQQQQQQQGGPMGGRPEEYRASSSTGSGHARDLGSRPALSHHGLDESDLRESLEQLRRSQQYSVADAPAYPSGLPNLRQPPPSLVPSFRDEPSGAFQKSSMDAYSGKAGGANRPFGLGSSAGQTVSSLYGSLGSSGGTFGTSSSRGGGDASRTNEYRRSSLGPTAPTDYGRSPPPSSYGYRRHDSSSSKRY